MVDVMDAPKVPSMVVTKVGVTAVSMADLMGSYKVAKMAGLMGSYKVAKMVDLTAEETAACWVC